MERTQWPSRPELEAIQLNRIQQMNKFADMLIICQPDIIRAYPSSLAVFANYLKEQNIAYITPKFIDVTVEKMKLFRGSCSKRFLRTGSRSLRFSGDIQLCLSEP